MDHKRYEDWIFSDGELSPGDRRALHEHLTACDRCDRLDRNWRAARGMLQTAGAVSPSPGFSKRWMRRLETENRRRRALRSAALFGLTFAAASFTFSIFLVRVIGGMLDLGGALLHYSLAVSDRIAAVPAGSMTLNTLSGSPFILLLPLAIMGFFAFLGAGAITWLKMFRVFARCQGLSRWG